jgi:competence protein ComGC
MASRSAPEKPMRRNKGLTIIQLMLILLVLGIVAKVAIDFMMDKRCEDDPALQWCADRKNG